jgi:hypothetical protein
MVERDGSALYVELWNEEIAYLFSLVYDMLLLLDLTVEAITCIEKTGIWQACAA